MYVWMILAVFMAAIFSFNIAPRDDMHEVSHIPAAEGVAGKMMTLHNAGLKLIQEDASFSGGVVGYDNGKLTSMELNNYLPTGYCYGTTAGCENDIQSEFETKVVCLDNVNYNTQVSCGDASAANFLITYGDVPKKWLLPHVNEPSIDLIQAMGRVSDDDMFFGYTTDFTRSNTYNSNIGIRSSIGTRKTVPEGAGVDKGKLVYLTRIR
jgi:hypothetical protein